MGGIGPRRRRLEATATEFRAEHFALCAAQHLRWAKSSPRRCRGKSSKLPRKAAAARSTNCRNSALL